MEIHNGDLALHVEVDGEADAPPVLLLHGITASSRTWDWLVPDLVERYRAIRLDFRGHGASGRAPGAYHMPGYVSDAVAACREVAGGPCAVVGHSLGGGTAAALAQRHPELVRGLVLEDPPLGPRRDLDGNALLDGFRQLRESVPRLQATGIPADTLADLLGQAPSAVGRPFGELLHADALAAMAAALLQLDATVLDPVLDGTIEPSYDAAGRLGVPTLVITADPASPDCVCRTADVEQLVVSSPDALVSVRPGASHLVHDELRQRDAFKAEVLAFLDRLHA